MRQTEKLWQTDKNCVLAKIWFSNDEEMYLFYFIYSLTLPMLSAEITLCK